jgi:hypothetical protein
LQNQKSNSKLRLNIEWETGIKNFAVATPRVQNTCNATATADSEPSLAAVPNLTYTYIKQYCRLKMGGNEDVLSKDYTYAWREGSDLSVQDFLTKACPPTIASF